MTTIDRSIDSTMDTSERASLRMTDCAMTVAVVDAVLLVIYLIVVEYACAGVYSTLPSFVYWPLIHAAAIVVSMCTCCLLRRNVALLPSVGLFLLFVTMVIVDAINVGRWAAIVSLSTLLDDCNVLAVGQLLFLFTSFGYLSSLLSLISCRERGGRYDEDVVRV